MWSRSLSLLLGSVVGLWLLTASPAQAQTLTGDRLLLKSGPCMVYTGSGTPEGVVTGNPCDVYINTADGVVWAKWTGTSSTGWNVGHNANARVNGTLDVTGYVGKPGYVSQTTAWRVDDLGAADFRYLFADELHVEKFIADLEQALAGGQIIAKSVTMSTNYTVPAAGAASTLTVRDLPSAENMAVFESGDTVRLRTVSRASGALTVADAYGVVTSYVDQPGGLQNWTFTRNAGSCAGSMAAGTVIEADSLLIDYGVSGNGYYEVNAIDGLYGVNSPYAQVVTWATCPIASNLTLRARIGNLRGITGITGEYGAILGTYAASNGRFLRASNQGVDLHGVDLSLWDGSTKTVFLDHTQPSFALGNPVPPAFNTGTGVWMGNDGGTYKFRIGNPSGNRFSFDGSTATFVGDGGGVTNINGGNIQTDTITATQIAANAITTSELNASAVTAGKIAAGTITADKLNVATLSAISANLGTVTAGHINGATAEFANTVDLDSNGITIASGTGGINSVKWSDGTQMWSETDTFGLTATDRIFLNGGTTTCGTIVIGQNIMQPSTGDCIDLGTSSQRFRDFYLTDTINWSSPPDTTADDYPMVYSTGNTQIYRKTNGFNGTCSNPTTITIDRGIVVGCS